MDSECLEPNPAGQLQQQAQPEQPAPGLHKKLPELPGPALDAVLAHLPVASRPMLRLVCKRLQCLVDGSTQRLRLTHLELLSQGALPERFPRVVWLELVHPSVTMFLSYSAQDGASQSSADGQQQPSISRPAAQQWAAVTTLRMTGTPADAAKQVLSLCPYLQVLVMNSMWHAATHGPDVATSIISSSRQHLQHLRSLTIGRGSPINSQALVLLASCTSLTALDVPINRHCRAAGWAALLGMTQLTSLELCATEQAAFPAGLALDFSGMSLVRLSLRGLHKGIEAPAATLQLPHSLQHLAAHDLLQHQVSPLQQLRSLELLRAKADSSFLPLLALSCPGLESLTLLKLQLASECRSKPLLALTSLVVLQRWDTRDGVKLADALPSLRRLSAPGGPNLKALKGLDALKWLDVGGEMTRIGVSDHAHGEADAAPLHGVGISLAGFKALSHLPHLTSLRLDARAGNVPHVTLLTHLTSITFLMALTPNSDSHGVAYGLHTSFSTYTAPQQLQSAVVEFHDLDENEGDHFDSDNEPADHSKEISTVADAAVVWLVCAPVLTHVRWDAAEFKPYHSCMLMNDLRLSALASNTSIKRIEVAQKRGVITQAMLKCVQRLHGGRGLEVVMLE